MGIKVKGFNDLESTQERPISVYDTLQGGFNTGNQNNHSVSIKGLDEADPSLRKNKIASEEELRRLKHEAIKQAFNLTHGPGKRKKKKRRK